MHQEPAQRWLESGPVCEADGLWIKGGPGFGKTTAMKLLCLRYPGQVYFAAVRAAIDDYDRTSFNGYRPEHSIVVFNDVKLKPKSRLFSTLREATDGLVLETIWGVHTVSVTVEAKIVVNSTSGLPNDAELRRRFSEVEIEEDGAVRTMHTNPLGTPGNKRVVAAEGAQSTSESHAQPAPRALQCIVHWFVCVCVCASHLPFHRALLSIRTGLAPAEETPLYPKVREDTSSEFDVWHYRTGKRWKDGVSGFILSEVQDIMERFIKTHSIPADVYVAEILRHTHNADLAQVVTYGSGDRECLRDEVVKAVTVDRTPDEIPDFFPNLHEACGS